MRKTSKSQACHDGTIRKFVPSSRAMNANGPGHFGYWSREEVLNFLGKIVEGERIAVAAYAAIGRAADPYAADLAFESELAQGAICTSSSRRFSPSSLGTRPHDFRPARCAMVGQGTTLQVQR